MLRDEDYKRIDDAIRGVEQKTWGDIYCIIAHEASNYREVPLAWAAVIALLLPPLAIIAGVSPVALADAVEGWRTGQAAFETQELVLALSLYAFIQTLLFAAIALVVSIPVIRRLATPSFLKRHRTQQLARQHFISTGLHLAKGQPHVLIFVAAMEHRVEILAGADVHKMAGEQTWTNASAAIVSAMQRGDEASGIVEAIGIAGAPLIEHFPATRREQPEGLAEI